MRQQLVYEALQSAESFLSGEELSRKLGITRAAVWKAVEALRKQGCGIEAKTGLGYRLTDAPDRLTSDAVGSYFSAPRGNLHILETVDSTNSACRRLALEGAPDGTVVVSDTQTAGRGRRGRSFQSPIGQGIFLSILWRPDCTPDKLLPVTALSAVAVCRAVERTCGVRLQIKWPNDLVLSGRKLSGILTEMALEGESGLVDHAVVGIGINVHQQLSDFTEDVAAIATSLDMALGKKVCRARLVAALIEELDTLRREILFAPEKWLPPYRRDCLNIGKPVQLLRSGGAEQVTAIGIDDQFGLIVHHPDGTEETVRSGEVSVRGLYGYAE